MAQLWDIFLEQLGVLYNKLYKLCVTFQKLKKN